uniref:Putative monoubiquitination-related protein n=1 Tax=Cryptococcus depauperatus TaxID=5208 RepID=D2JWY7_9TREE|nr:putative monoubiquitination-related protein [Cryptococcus depauperatus]
MRREKLLLNGAQGHRKEQRELCLLSKTEIMYGWEAKAETSCTVLCNYVLTIIDSWGSQLSSANGLVAREIVEAHESPVNRIFCMNPNHIASGDDEGVIKFWDPREEASIRTYSQHFDYITDFIYFEDKRQLVTTSKHSEQRSGDGHLSVIDIRSNKAQPLSISDDQEDELLSIVPIKRGTKAIVGSGLGVLSIWDRKKGWGDCVDRIPGHPASVDAMVALTPDIVATGSEDGMIRWVLLPHMVIFLLSESDWTETPNGSAVLATKNASNLLTWKISSKTAVMKMKK